MKIIGLVGGRPQHLAFINRIHRKHPVELVVVEAVQWSGVKGFRNRLRSSFAMGGRTGRIPIKVRSRAEAAIYDRQFGDDWRDLDGGIEVMWTSDINAPAVQRRLEEAGADLLVDHGTAIVKPPVIETTPLALNLHWGLSPYYRGTNCTEWALLHWDPYNIGVTVHRLAQRIDGGDIVGQARVDIDPRDTPLSINMKLTAAGTDIMISAINRLAAGGSLTCAPQDLNQGHLTLNRQWSGELRSHIHRLAASGDIQKMLAKPSRRKRLPIVTFE